MEDFKGQYRDCGERAKCLAELVRQQLKERTSDKGFR